VIPEVDHNNSEIAEQIHSLTMVQISLLREGGANLDADGVEDPDYFNPEAFLPQVVIMNQVNSISIHPQRPLGSGTVNSPPVLVPLIDPVPAQKCEDIRQSVPTYSDTVRDFPKERTELMKVEVGAIHLENWRREMPVTAAAL
jgi:hypothetical protein